VRRWLREIEGLESDQSEEGEERAGRGEEARNARAVIATEDDCYNFVGYFLQLFMPMSLVETVPEFEKIDCLKTFLAS